MQRRLRLCVLVLAVVLLVAGVACGGSSPSPTSPSPSPAPAPTPFPRIDASNLKPSTNYTIGFSSLRDNKAAFGTQLESGFTVSVVSANWVSITTYGNPQPFVEFFAPTGTTTTGELRITADGNAFWLNSIDLYSSTTKIPYVIEGYLNNGPAFSVVDVIGNTFGAFARRSNPRADVPVQEIRLRLSNPSAPCCENPMGVDNIVVSR